jgi:methionyl-tRNA formyltransferase
LKIIIFTGSHARHLYVHQEVIRHSTECAIVLMEREQIIPNIPSGIPKVDQRNWERHFAERNEIEVTAYGHLHPESVFSNMSLHKCRPETLNSDATANFVRDFNPGMAFIFGTDLIKDPVHSALPEIRINLHLGLSPWYRGSATLFWPFYFLQPQFAGATFHQIVPEADAGGILHQTVPVLESADGIHDVGVKTVVKAKYDLAKLLKLYTQNGWEYQKQKSSGRLFLTRDFEPHHLRMIYNLYDNNIVDAYLNGALGSRKPVLVSAL